MAELDRKIIPMNTLRNSIVGIWALLVTVFIAVTFYYIVYFYMEPLSRDQWHMYQALFEQGLLKTSISTVSGHRHILAFLLYDIDMILFDGRNIFLTVVNQLLNGTLIVILCSQASKLPLSRLARVLLCGWIIVLLTWLLNIALLGWGFNGINNYLSIVPFTAAILLLHIAVHQQRTALCIPALLLGLLATLSFANGMLVWPTALLSLYLWRASKQFYIYILFAGAIAITTYFLLPGADAAQAALKWPGWALLTFPTQVMGGPIYHLLRSWRIADEQTLIYISSTCGAVITLTALPQFFTLLRKRPSFNTFSSICVALLCFGAGSTVMLTMSRLDDFLDMSADRFQIFALLVWIGTSGLYYCSATPTAVRRWEICFIAFPLLAFPSQLDWGARLAEYHSRVDNALLSYQVYLPVKNDAEKALHWNWQNKLQALFYVLEHIRTDHKNIFFRGQADWVGKSFNPDDAIAECQLTVQKTELIVANDLLDVTPFNSAANYNIPFTQPTTDVGQRWYFDISDRHWDYGILVDRATDKVDGLIQQITYSELPRANGFIRHSYNAHGVSRLINSASTDHTLVLFQAQKPICTSNL